MSPPAKAREIADFNLTVEKIGQRRCRARVECQRWGVGDTADFTLPPPFQIPRTPAGRHAGPRRDVREHPAGDPKQIGTFLFDLAFPRNLRTLWARCLDRSCAREERLRLRLTLSDVPELAALPWEYLYDPERNRFLTLIDEVIVVRAPRGCIPLERLRPTPPLRILLALACPRDLPRLDLDGERAKIESHLGDLENAGLVAIECCRHATWQEIWHRLAEPDTGSPPCHVLHFMGHGAFDAAARRAFLMFEGPTGTAARVGELEIQAAFSRHPSLRLLVLNACETAQGAADDAFAGLAQGLSYQAIPALVAIQFRIRDATAIRFSERMYTALAGGTPVDLAVARARASLGGASEPNAWAAPVLFLRAPDGDLFDLFAPLPPPGETAGSPAEAPPAAAQGAPLPHDDQGVDRARRRRGWARQLIASIGLLLVAASAWWGWLAGWRPLSAPGPRPVPGGRAAALPASSPGCEVPPALERLGVQDLRFRRIGPGTFQMGAARGDPGAPGGPRASRQGADEGPVHEVTLSAWCMQMTEVTQAQWQAVMHANPSHDRGPNLPVDTVSWNAAQTYVQQLNQLAGTALFRLPTEAEWEYAARAGSTGRYSFGDDPPQLPRFGNCRSASRPAGWHTLPAASLEPNPWGLYDMYGNVQEWVEDAYARYGEEPQTDPLATPSPAAPRVLRGGSWDNDAQHCRSASRDNAQPGYASQRTGFRLARILSPAP